MLHLMLSGDTLLRVKYNNMNNKYGLRGELNPKSAFKEVDQFFFIENISFNIKNCLLEIGYDNTEDKEKALRMANTLLASWSKRNHIKVTAEFNISWEVKPNGGKSISMCVNDQIKTTDRVVTTSVIMKAMAYIIKPISDSYSFLNDVENVKKAEKDKTLSLVLSYFHEEIIDNKKPMYGIHKAMEQIIKTLHGKNDSEKRDYLAVVVGCSRKYIDDLMSSIQNERHSEEWLRLQRIGKLLNNQECIERASKIIEAYSKSIQI